MQTYRVILNGRATRSALGETARGALLIEGWDRGEARAAAERKLSRGPLVLAGVRCDEVEIVGIERAGRGGRR